MKARFVPNDARPIGGARPHNTADVAIQSENKSLAALAFRRFVPAGAPFARRPRPAQSGAAAVPPFAGRRRLSIVRCAGLNGSLRRAIILVLTALFAYVAASTFGR